MKTGELKRHTGEDRKLNKVYTSRIFLEKDLRRMKREGE